MAESSNADHRNALVRFGIGQTQPTPYCVSGAENGGRLFVAESVGDEHGCVRVGQHVFSMATLSRDTGRDVVLAQFFLAAQAPLATSAAFLHPPHADAVPYFA